MIGRVPLTIAEASVILVPLMSSRRLAIVMVIVLWVLLGPVGMTFTCAAMDGCDLLCGTTSAAMQIPPTAVASVSPVHWVASSLDGHLPLNSGHVLDTPPKFAPRSL
jgi:hypothetical protein